jgi:hypothetical protein
MLLYGNISSVEASQMALVKRVAGASTAMRLFHVNGKALAGYMARDRWQ